MWCCFTANTVVEPTKLKPLTADVPVTTKPVTLMFRLPSEEEAIAPAPASAPEAVEAAHVEEPLENPQAEEVPSVDDACGNPCTILLAIGVIGLLYAMMSQSEKAEL